jgi:hypothetical protein
MPHNSDILLSLNQSDLKCQNITSSSKSSKSPSARKESPKCNHANECF